MAADQAIETSDTTDVLSGELGVILKRHREEHGLNVNQVAEALCLSPKIITALEAENLGELPEPPYVRGYLRSFAKFTEIDPSEMIAAYEKLRGAEPNHLDYHFATSPATSQKKSGISSGIFKLGLLIALLGLLAILSMVPSVRGWIDDTWNRFSEQADPGFTETNQNDNPLLTGNIPPPLPIDDDSETGSTPIEGDAATVESTSPEVNSGFPSVTDTTALTSEATENDQGLLTNTTDSTTDDNTLAASEVDNTDTEKTPEGSSTLKLVFNDEVWMRIRDSDKKKLFEALSQKGDTKELVLPRPMVIRVGNAQNLELTVDGKPFDLTPFTRGSVANFTIE